MWIENFGIVPTGCCTFTKSGNLPAHYVIHAVGPIWHNDWDKDLLKRQLESCIVNILEMSKILGTYTVSIPAISTGIYSFPKELCA